jgi:hypothetical protein
MTDAGFVAAAYTVIVGGLGVYAAVLRWRLARARARLEGQRRGRRAST